MLLLKVFRRGSNMFIKYVLLICVVFSVLPNSVIAMRKRAGSDIESEEPEGKLARIPTEETQPAEAKKIPFSDPLPDEILARIAEFMTSARGANEKARLYNAAQSIRTFLMSAKVFEDILNDRQLHGRIIQDLAARYTNNNIVEAALALGTRAGGEWLQKELFRKTDNNRDMKHASNALMSAVEQGQAGVLRFLFTFVPDLIDAIQNSYDSNGKTALLLAIENGASDIAKILIRRGINVNTTNQAQDEEENIVAPLALAVQLRRNDLIDMLLQAGANVNVASTTDNVGFSLTVLGWAIYHNDSALLARLLAAPGVNPNFQVATGGTPLILAANAGNIAAVDLLLAAGANPNEENQDEEAESEKVLTPLFASIRIKQGISPEDFKIIIAKLLAAGADVNAADSNNVTPLMFAIQERPDLVPILLNAGARVNEQDSQQGLSPLMRAVSMIDQDVIQQLLDRNANVSLVDRFGRTAVDLARLIKNDRERDQIIARLQSKK